jgi:alkylation response protein AidB-like acyl-CoA dehydrogenase
MELSLSPDQVALQDNVRRYCKEKYDLKTRQSIVSGQESFSRAHWSAFAELGWLGAAFPEDVGGTNGSAIESAIILEQFGRALVVEPYWSCAVFAGQLIEFCASPHHRRELLVPMIEGKLLVTVAHDELAAVGVLDHVGTTATKTRDGYILRGKKTLVFGGPCADKLIVSARTSGEVGHRNGICLFMVDRDAAGLKRNDYRMVDGTSASDLALDRVEVMDGDLLGSPGGGLEALQFAKDQALVALCAETVGAIDGVLWTTRDYLRARRQYGTTLNTMQALQHRMADMFMEVELSRSILLRALSFMSGEEATKRSIGALSAKIHVTQSGKHVCKYGVQLHGGLGVTEDHIVGQYFKRVAVISNTFGSLQGQINECADLLIDGSPSPEESGYLKRA